MSRLAIVSDIHGNLEALRAVLDQLEPSDELLCLGDTVGYGPNPNECVALIRGRVRAAVMGNHDLAAIEGYGVEYFNPAARSAIAWTQSVLAKEHAEWLADLEYEERTAGYLLVHGAPERYFSYILDVAGARRAFGATDAPLIFVGHSHVAEYYALDGARIEHRHVQRGGSLSLVPGVRYIVNAGSIGQPRDLNPEASFALFDDVTLTVEWRRVAYDIEAVRAKIEAAGLPPYLGARLLLGR